MIVNRTKQALKTGQTVIGTTVNQFAIPPLPRLLAAAGLDFITIDTEHAPNSFETIANVVRVARPAGLTVLVRVTDALYHLVARSLDVGAEGVVIPRVESAQTVRYVVDGVKYPPVGRRGYGVGSIHTDYEPVSIRDAIEHLNANTMIVLQIETAAAVEAIDEILSVGEVDVALFGPYDLSVSLGCPGEFEHPRLVEAGERIIASARRCGVFPGVYFGDMRLLKAWQARGVPYLVYANEERLFLDGARAAVAELRASEKNSIHP